MSRIDILKGSLREKENNFFGKLGELYKDVKRTNGQPLNDKKGAEKGRIIWDKDKKLVFHKFFLR